MDHTTLVDERLAQLFSSTDIELVTQGIALADVMAGTEAELRQLMGYPAEGPVDAVVQLLHTWPHGNHVPLCRRQLPQLNTLRLHDNRITAAPDWVGELVQLEVLDLRHNRRRRRCGWRRVERCPHRGLQQQ